MRPMVRSMVSGPREFLSAVAGYRTVRERVGKWRGIIPLAGEWGGERGFYLDEQG